MAIRQRPQFSAVAARDLAQTYYGLTAVSATPLPSDRDQNFLLQTETGTRYILKLAQAGEDEEILHLQQAVLSHLHQNWPEASPPIPQIRPSTQGEGLVRVAAENGRFHYLHLLTYLPGRPLGNMGHHPPALLRQIGHLLAQVDSSLHTVNQPAARRQLHWDLAQAPATITRHQHHISQSQQQALLTSCLTDYEQLVAPHLPHLRRQIIHGDANDYNLLADPDSLTLTGLIDFGDLVYSATIYELAIAAAYALLHKEDPVAAACHVAAGYHAHLPLTETEISILFPLIRLRLAQSVAMSAYQHQQEPDNSYLTISQQPAWAALAQLAAIPPALAYDQLRAALETTQTATGQLAASLLQKRQRYLGPMLSLSYEEPIHIVRGQGQYLYDAQERPYLDMVNNVAHVGHSHPYVVAALYQQAQQLNTNTRYLHEAIIHYAERLTATLPQPLQVCFFVNSGSEANDLALRLARAHTGQQDVIVVDGAYHGHLTSLIEISPYKFKGPGGTTPPNYVHVSPMPDPYRGQWGADGAAYAQQVARIIADMGRQGRKPAAFICESLLGCGGQIVLPDGYLTAVYQQVRAAGGVTIADEVQVGLGRIGSHFWGFSLQGVVPDIVTMGKPLGNGHPLAAVVTTPAIAASFNTGMEYFNTYGGNPVSCTVGTAVLDVIEAEGLQTHAAEIGRYLLDELTTLKASYPLIGDVRGRGLFLGIELVHNQETKEPAAAAASTIVERMKQAGILLSTDGPLHNVIKIKPPLPFTRQNADFFLTELTAVLQDK